MATKREALLWDDGRLTDIGHRHELTPEDAARARWVELDPEQRHPYPSPAGYDPATRRVVQRARTVAELSDAEVALVALARPQDRAVAAEVVARAGRILPTPAAAEGGGR